MSEFDFWTSVIIYQKLGGVAYYEKERNNGGRVIGLWPLRPDWTSPKKSSASLIGGYEYAPPGLSPVLLKTEDVLVFQLFDPLSMYHGWPPAAVAARSGDIDNSATDYLKLFFEKGGQPPGLLKTKQKLQDVDVTNIRRRWRERYGGMEHWLEPAVLDSDAEFQKIGFSFQEMGFDVLDTRNEARICMALDVPPIIVGAKAGLDSATYSNYAQARLAWWQDSLLPMYQNLSDEISAQLVPDFGDGIVVKHDFSAVPALQEALNSQWARADSAISKGYITVNEARAEIGLPSLGTAGDVFLRPMNMTESPARVGAKTKTHEYKTEPPNDESRQRLEDRFDGLMRGYFDGQLKRIERGLADRAKAEANGHYG